MIVQRKQIGTRKDLRGNDKPVWGADIPPGLEGKIRSVHYNPETDDYRLTLKEETKTNQLLDQIATLIEESDISTEQGKNDLAQQIRNCNQS